jgi:RNA polymerase sigma-70 factor (ECF subfamily)
MQPSPSEPAPSEPAACARAEENLLLADLLARTRQGDQAAFAAFYDRTVRGLLALVRSLVRDGQAEDVLADTYLHVWRHVGSYDPSRAPPGAWLALVARSRALDHLRREKSHGARERQEMAQAGIDSSDRSGCPERLLSSAEERMLVHLSLSGRSLSHDERNVIGLAYFRECTHQEIAGITGLPLGTVKSTMLRAHDKLRLQLLALGSAGKPSSP